MNNLLDFYNAMDDFDQTFTEFYVVANAVRCYWCKRDSHDDKDYRVIRKLTFNSRDEDLASVDYYSIIEIDSTSFIVVTGRSCSSYHCRKCSHGPVPISDEDMELYKTYIKEALVLLRKETGLQLTVRLINRRAGNYGAFNPAKPLKIELNIGALTERHMDVKKSIFSTAAHEARHAWQYANNWEFDHKEDYYERPHEIDARAYAKGFLGRVFGTTDLN